MLRFEGDRDFTSDQADVFAKLTDARFLVTCIPDVESLVQVESNHATLVLRPGLSFMRGTLEVTLQVAEVTPPAAATVLLHSKGIGSSSAVEAVLTFRPREPGARVHWSAEVKELGGLLKMVPAGLIRGAAQKVINDVWTRVEAQLAPENPSPTA